MKEKRMGQSYIFFAFKSFASRHIFISITFFVLTTIIGLHTRFEFSIHSTYRDRHQNLNEGDSSLNYKNCDEKMFHGFYDIAKQFLIRSCDST